MGRRAAHTWNVSGSASPPCNTLLVSADPSGTSPLSPGVKLDRYELLYPIAEGGMAAVWVVRLLGKHGFEKLLALKMILPEFATDVNFQEMLLDEARIAAGIHHVNVAHVLDLGEEHGILYLAMECVDGDSVSKLHTSITQRGDVFPPAIALRIVADACAGLHAAHELRDKEGRELCVVHRDVSPQNILIDTSGTVKIIDFGIARARDRIAAETRTGSIKGKIQFMSPEQATGRPIDRRADIWGAGAVLYKLLAGRPPFEGPNKFSTLHQIASGARPRPLPAEVAPEIAAIVEKALAHDPAARFENALVMRNAIEGVMTKVGLTASSSDVAALASKYLAAAIANRRNAIDAALREAAERDRRLPFVASSVGAPQPSPFNGASPGAARAAHEGMATVVLGARDESEVGAMALALSPRALKRLLWTGGALLSVTMALVFALKSSRSSHPQASETVVNRAVTPAAEMPAEVPSAPPAVEPAPAVVPGSSLVKALPARASEGTLRTNSTRGSANTEARKSGATRRASPQPAAKAPSPAPKREPVIDDGF